MPRDSIARALAIQALGGGIANALTINSGGAGSASGTTYNGSVAVTISYNSIGAAPLTAPTFVGPVTVSSGLLHGAGDGQIDGNLTAGTNGGGNSHVFWGLVSSWNGITIRSGSGLQLNDVANGVSFTLSNDGTNISTNGAPFAAASYKVAGTLVINSSGVLQAVGVPAFAGGDVTSIGGSLTLTLGAFTGDIVKTAGSLATTIAANAVTFAKMQALSAGGKLLGSAVGSTAVAEITVGTGLTVGTSTLRFANISATTLLGNSTGGATTPGEITLAGGLAFSGTTLTAAGPLTPTSLASTGVVTSSSATAGIGYATGAGGAVTQVTSRTTGVTLNKICGAITLVSAAGSATWNTFTVTNSAVAATDTVEICQKSGANLYNVIVTAIAAGTFNVSVSAVSGTATESPVFNFVIVKAVAA